ncbi:acyl-CoA dehydrogenase family protein [Brevibacterium atlanticum]|uniref:acyl-CoA dehydrogenase family protein n=1 Tax=Brevibacterium atlanticum TaxID=2697563 RepID=UPI00141F946E|nr:acyl-CoA dehydrogenase family protein [Brevibacterium atlanticum]
MDFAPNDDHEALREAIRAVCRDFDKSYYVQRAEAGEPTTEAWKALGDHGFIGINMPEEYGGGGAGLTELAIVCEESAAAGVPQLLLLVSSAISGEVIANFGTQEQKEKWLPGMADGSKKVVFAITEPDAGTNSHRIATTAREVEGGWTLSGTKHFISGVDEADAVLVVARTDTDDATGSGELSLFIVETDAPGLVRHRLPVSVALPEKQFTLFFDEVSVGQGSLVGEIGKGLKQVFHGLNPERITGAAICVGVGRLALERASDYARERRVWDVPIGAHQGVSHALAQAKIEVELASLMTSKAAWLHDHDLPAGEASNMAKYAAAEAGLAATDAAIQIHGGNGLATEYGLLPYWALARLLRIAPINRDMILNHVAQHSLGLPRSY